MLREMLYADAVAKRAHERALCREDGRIPLPGLAHPETQLGIPLLVRDELLGVLCIETDGTYRFHEQDRAYVEVLGGYLAIAIQNALLLERTEDAEDPPHKDATAGVRPAVPGRRSDLRVAYYESDECILVDGEYLVRGLPAKILWKLLRQNETSGEVEFTNRRLRLDKSLQLPAFKDNLESRLILLRRRLDERCPEVRLVQSGRGRFRLEIGSRLALEQHP